MRILLQPFVLVVTALLALTYLYVAGRLTVGLPMRIATALPFVLVWVVPVLYWSRRRDRVASRLDDLVHQASYLSMAWVSFVLVLTLARDLLLALANLIALAPLRDWLVDAGRAAVLLGSMLALAVGVVSALRGPRVSRQRVPVSGLHPDLQGFRIVQISDLHVGRAIRRPYVERTVALARSLTPDLVALTGDLVDGSVRRLARDVAPLAALAESGRAFFVLGNHDCYSGATQWIEHFRSLGLRVLLNDHVRVQHAGADVLVGGVVDPAYHLQRPAIANAAVSGAAFRLLLAHNPKLAPLGARAGYDLQLSGHTHAGQFFPWTLAVRLVHAPHVAGLSREGSMWVYVSAGTGSWGPPVRFGTTPEITLLELVAATTPESSPNPSAGWQESLRGVTTAKSPPPAAACRSLTVPLGSCLVSVRTRTESATRRTWPQVLEGEKRRDGGSRVPPEQGTARASRPRQSLRGLSARNTQPHEHWSPPPLATPRGRAHARPSS